MALRRSVLRYPEIWGRLNPTYAAPPHTMDQWLDALFNNTLWHRIEELMK